jgi:putative hydrolase of the HAD superfamily
MKTIFFDLDNTLYDAKQYHLGSFKEISEYLSKKYNRSKNKIYKRLIKLLKEKTSFYPYLFDDLLNFLNLKEELEKVIKIFNNYNGKIRPYPDVKTGFKKTKK